MSIEEDFDRNVRNHEAIKLMRTRAVIAVIVGVGLVLSSIMVWGILEIRDTQLNGTPVGKKILETSETIEDCSTPGGECYRRNQQDIAGAIDSVNDYTIFAITCGVNLVQGERRPSTAEVKKCVSDAMQEKP